MRPILISLLMSLLSLSAAQYGDTDSTLATTPSTAPSDTDTATTDDYIRDVPLDSATFAFGQTAQINWSQGSITVEGAGTAAPGLTQAQARLRALGAARADALRLLAVTVDGINITAETTVRDYALESDVIRTSLDAFIRGAVFPSGGERVEQFDDGSFIVYATAVLPLYGSDSLSDTVLPPFQDRERQGGSQGHTPAAPETLLSQTLRHSYFAQAQSPFTGLIIDAGDTPIAASLAPSILSDSGDTVYGITDVAEDAVGTLGVATFFNTVTGATTDPRVGANPLIIRAVGVDGSSGALVGSTPIISAEDAERIRQANETTGFLEQGGVSIVGRGGAETSGESTNELWSR